MSKSRILYACTVAAIVFIGLLFFLFNDIAPPTFSLTPDIRAAGVRQNITLTVTDATSNLKSVNVVVAQNNQRFVILDRAFTTREKTHELRFALSQANLNEGPFKLIITAVDTSWANFGQGNTTTQQLDGHFDTKPPRINITTLMPNIRRGSTTALAYTVSKKTEKTGVQIGDYFFPAFLQKNNRYHVVFPFPLSMPLSSFKPKVIAYDLAGNIAEAPVILNAIDRGYPHDTIRISDSFLRAKMPAFVDVVPDAANDLERYIAVNDTVRLANEKTLFELAEKTSKVKLWSGAMIRLPRSAARARFGDDRTYTYDGKAIDRQTHMGLDLASMPKVPIPAANNGIVVFAGDLGIFGNLVVVDHGLTLMSLYGHMSKIDVAVGDAVKKGDILGNTGATGLAGGDHLHFGMLVGGLQVQPMDWFDKKWVQNSILDNLSAK